MFRIMALISTVALLAMTLPSSAQTNQRSFLIAGGPGEFLETFLQLGRIAVVNGNLQAMAAGQCEASFSLRVCDPEDLSCAGPLQDPSDFLLGAGDIGVFSFPLDEAPALDPMNPASTRVARIEVIGLRRSGPCKLAVVSRLFDSTTGATRGTVLRCSYQTALVDSAEIESGAVAVPGGGGC